MGEVLSSTADSTSGATVQNGLVAVENIMETKGRVSILGRYTTQRSLHSDYNFQICGKKTGRYFPPKVIGTGMNGPVHLAIGQDGKKYAVKSFKKQQLDARHRADLKNEVEIYLSLDHPHIARLEQVYETEDDIHLVMEFMAGGEAYERLSQKRQYTEEATAEAAHQMLLAVAYLHAHNICHRDLKLENFLYESRSSNHLKLIDFGFAKIRTAGTKLKKPCGSLHYVAPEVLAQSYTEQADMWSLGVISHMLLTGSPVFRGSDSDIMRLIRKGRKQLSSRFGKLSESAQDFVQSLLVIDPAERLTAQGALEHPFVASQSSRQTSVNVEVVDDLRKYAEASRFRRACLSMMAWSLSQEDRKHLQGKFLELDVEKKGTISLPQFKAVLLDNYHVNGAEAERLFSTLDTDHDNEICYSEFLAAVLQDRVHMHENLLRKTFSRFDRDEAGMITVDNLRTVLGDTFEDVDVKDLIEEVDVDGNGSICYEEFLQYLQNPEPSSAQLTCTIQRQRVSTPAGRLVDKLISEDLDAVKQLPLTPLSAQAKTGPAQSSLMRAAALAVLQ